MSPHKMVLLVLLSCTVVTAALVENCEEEKWLPEGTDYTSPPKCEDYDGTLLPDCGHFVTDERTSYYHVHQYGM